MTSLTYVRFRGLFRCRCCGHVHGANGVHVTYPDGQRELRWIKDWNRDADGVARSPWRCPECAAGDCQYLTGTRIPRMTWIELWAYLYERRAANRPVRARLDAQHTRHEKKAG